MIFRILPVGIFIIASFVVFFTFIRGAFILLSAGTNIQRLIRGRDILLKSLYALLIILITAFVFFFVTYLVKQGEILKPPEATGDFPGSPIGSLPPLPNYIEISKYYFAGPKLMEKKEQIENSAVYAILCKKNEEYDIIYIGESKGKEQLQIHREYGCWQENCSNNLYLAVFFTPQEEINVNQRRNIVEELKELINPPCPVSEEFNL